jgi:hypothetical protein
VEVNVVADGGLEEIGERMNGVGRCNVLGMKWGVDDGIGGSMGYQNHWEIDVLEVCGSIGGSYE